MNRNFNFIADQDHQPLSRLWLVLLCLLMVESTSLSAEDFADSANSDDPSEVQDVVSIEISDLNESSGLAISYRKKNHFWSHNDSGGKAQLFAFNSKGKQTGMVKLKSARATDWEDMASFQDEHVSRILVADCGDNLAKRKSIELYLLDEPDPTDSTTSKTYQSLSVTYTDGPQNCEAVYVDTRTRRIILATKSAIPRSAIYSVPLPDRREKLRNKRATARRITTVPIPMVTAMDMDPNNGDLWLANYFQVFCFKAVPSKSPLDDQLGALPVPLVLPRWKQIEAIAIDQSGDLWVTSEGVRPPLGRIDVSQTFAN
jgi:hypothetical protein